MRGSVENLFQTYRVGNVNTSLNVELEENIFFDMDVAVPLGIIINELVSNSIKYAFPDRKRGLIRISLHDNSKGSFILEVSDDGIGLPKLIDMQSTTTMGHTLVRLLTEQIDGSVEINRNKGTKFTITFKKV